MQEGEMERLLQLLHDEAKKTSLDVETARERYQAAFRSIAESREELEKAKSSPSAHDTQLLEALVKTIQLQYHGESTSFSPSLVPSADFPQSHNPYSEKPTSEILFSATFEFPQAYKSEAGTIQVRPGDFVTVLCKYSPMEVQADDTRKGNAVTKPGQDDFIGLYPAEIPLDFHSLQSNHFQIEYMDGRDTFQCQFKVPNRTGKYLCHYVHEYGAFVSSSDVICVSDSIPLEEVSHAHAIPKLMHEGSDVSTHSTQDNQQYVHKEENKKSNLTSTSVSAPTASPSSSSHLLPGWDSLSRAGMYQPPYLLETQVHISTFVLSIPLPEVVCAAVPEHTDVSEHAKPPQPSVILPNRWAPGVEYLDNDKTLLVQMQLPLLPLSESSLNIDDSDSLGLPNSKNSPSASIYPSLYSLKPEHIHWPTVEKAKLTQFPRAVYSLRIPLAYRVDPQESTCEVHSKEVVFRFKMYYTGSGVSKRPNSMVTLEEQFAWRRYGLDTRCIGCGAHILQQAARSRDVEAQTGTAGAASLSSSTSETLREPQSGELNSPSSAATAVASTEIFTNLLPSPYWLDWADSWICHMDDNHRVLPLQDFGSISGVLLLGETHVRIHPFNLRLDAVVLHRAQVEEWDLQLHDKSIEPQEAHSDEEEEERKEENVKKCALRPVKLSVDCARCLHPLGLVSFTVPTALYDAIQTSTYPIQMCPHPPMVGPINLDENASETDGDEHLHGKILGGCVVLYPPASGWKNTLHEPIGPLFYLHKHNLFLPWSLPESSSDLPNKRGNYRCIANETSKDRSIPSNSIRRQYPFFQPTVPPFIGAFESEQNTLQHYSVLSHLSSQLMHEMNAKGKYRFLLMASEDKPIFEQVIGECTSSFRRGIPFLFLTTINWNMSLRANTSSKTIIQQSHLGPQTTNQRNSTNQEIGPSNKDSCDVADNDFAVLKVGYLPIRDLSSLLFAPSITNTAITERSCSITIDPEDSVVSTWCGERVVVSDLSVGHSCAEEHLEMHDSCSGSGHTQAKVKALSRLAQGKSLHGNSDSTFASSKFEMPKGIVLDQVLEFSHQAEIVTLPNRWALLEVFLALNRSHRFLPQSKRVEPYLHYHVNIGFLPFFCESPIHVRNIHEYVRRKVRG